MRLPDLLRLLLLAFLWGSSFLLLRLIVPTLGPIVTAEARVAIASLALLVWCLGTRTRLDLRRDVVPMTIVGLFNSAIPFALFAFALRTIPAGYGALLNATSPLFGALVARAVWGEPLGGRRVAGIACGIAGVACLVRLGPVVLDAQALTACIACVAAALCYGFAGNYARRLARPIDPTAMATGSQLAAAVALSPLIPFDRTSALPSGSVIGATLALGIASTAAAYLLYFRLIRDVGATRALTVTFLVPLFAIALAWGVLDEPVTWRMAVGAGLVLVATGLVLSSPRAPRRS